jgi:hypothetical protein
VSIVSELLLSLYSLRPLLITSSGRLPILLHVGTAYDLSNVGRRGQAYIHQFPSRCMLDYVETFCFLRLQMMSRSSARPSFYELQFPAWSSSLGRARTIFQSPSTNSTASGAPSNCLSEHVCRHGLFSILLNMPLGFVIVTELCARRQCLCR